MLITGTYISFIPRKESARPAWGLNLKEKAAFHAATLGLAPEVVTQLDTAATGVVDKTNKVPVKYQEYQEALSAKNLLVTNELAEIIRIAGIIKRSPGYTENIGRELGIVGSSTTIDTNYIKPALKAETFPGFVAITFNKQKQLGICLYSRIKGTMGWELLARPRVSPYKDIRPIAEQGVAETREYLAMYWNGEEELGQQSDIVFTLFGG